MKPLFCKTHKKEDMIDVISNRNFCISELCNKIACFNIDGEKKAIYCKEHKKENMVDNKHKQCAFKDCKTRPNYNYKNMKGGIYCKTHKLENMIDVQNACCEYDNCFTRPTFNIKGEAKPLYCKEHAPDNMVNVVDKKCVLCGLFQTQKKYDYYCFDCYRFTFPDKAISRNHKTKENQIFSDLIKLLPDSINIVRDSIIRGGCSKRRPDGLIQLNDYNIIIEIDEEQHAKELYECEDKRIMEIFQDLGNSPLVVVRFNPDRYINAQGKIGKKLFGFKNGSTVLELLYKKQYDQRINTLYKEIIKYIHSIPEKEVTINYLYYDGFE
jgi:hypothetical protein